MKKEKSETDNVYVCYCILREMHPGKHQAERLREITEALWDAQTFYEKMGALMFGQAFVYGSREVVVRLLFMKKDSEKRRRSLRLLTVSVVHYCVVMICSMILCREKRKRRKKQRD